MVKHRIHWHDLWRNLSVSYLFKPKPIPTVTNAGNSFFRLLIPGVHLLHSPGWNDMGAHLFMNLWCPVLDEDPTTVRSCVRSGGCCTSDGAGYGMERLFICWNSAKRSDWISMAFESIEKCSNPCWLGAMPPNARGIAGYTKLCMVAGTGWRALGSGYRPRHEPSGC